MKAKDYIIKYIMENNYNTYDFLKKDSLLSLCESFGYDNNCYRKQNRLNYLYDQKMVCSIDRLLRDKGIQYVIFKGLCLAELLYDSPNDRKVGDIDIYVDYDRHNETMNLLSQLDIVKDNDKESDYVHHICLTNGKVMVELHKRIFNPFTLINETYLMNNITTVEINKRPINSFTITATMLHLIYHLYMDTWLSSCSLYSVLTNRNFPKIKRFLYRAYEISLFSEKYFDEINWEDIENDVAIQKLRVIFKKMIFDILKIFPEAFPQSFVDTVCKINYIEDERDQIYKYFIDTNANYSDDFDTLLSNYIDENWEARRDKNIFRKVGEAISLIKESSDETEQDLKCVVDIEKIAEGLKMVINVSNDDFYISEIDNYDTQTSDGVHLLLCGTEQYSYNSIFFFPKQIDGEIRVVVCDVINNRNNVLADNLIKAKFSKTEKDYTITAILSNKFLKENNLNSYLYMGLVISDCSSKTHSRENELILSEDDTQWCNPIYFAKIDLL